MSVFEMNTTNPVADVDSGRVNKNSPIVEVFSALTAGRTPTVSEGVLKKSVETIREMAGRALNEDRTAVSDINSIIRFTVEPRIIESIRALDLIGTFRRIGFNEAPMMRTYKFEDVGARLQANSGDVPFASLSWKEYPIATQCISSGFAVDYRELESGEFAGAVAEGLRQVKTDMQNKAVYYVINELYKGIKGAKGVKHFAEAAGLTEDAVNKMLKVMRRYGPVTICGDYSMVSQLNGYAGFRVYNNTDARYASDALTDEINRNGLVSYYNGASVVELPNAYDWTTLNADKSNFETYLPQGLLFFVPRGNVSPLQIFQRGGLTTMTATDIVTRQHLTRFDLEIGAGVAEGMEDMIGLVSDTNL